ncbi:aminodeoxychorismate lyase [Acinetobacter lwoffii]|uniref:Aminodeoxychorismate lyase n=1 Tax=Acinetobacter lwoffii NCTC 5866 = CIP 64.10 = NIPH 512 TaxID=981327 RepID=A0ABN0Q1P8_ACILW|nr:MULTISPECIES: aminodeoxychorismate lyase [Acinetobacter]AUC07322.1 aminodeoxychorismate lyase [Acinetobacter lwoffii]ENU17289.1 aminodeoxychorismate lyase [Acinetobacter sp. CIP A162]ESJ96724.1 aminodeoxychorismate lyase [Acinetobacter lwoffii NCTC 5866 = CIP 64.10 = NIPH 512]QXB39821.1 aminodeoxychorismate lyase [Acinetobacter lwoffii]SUU36348.1 4-amino-4-deoxychorismate lyase [Acinetobacter lwoffii]
MLYLKNAQRVSHIEVLDRGFHYGDGCFTTARIRHNRIELYDRHLTRLQNSNQSLSLNANLDLITESLQLLGESEGKLNGTLKIVLSRGVGQRGYSLPDHPADLWLFYYPQDIQDFKFEQIQSGVLQQAVGLTMPSLVGLKTLNRLEQVLLKQEADQRGWPEALVTDVQGGIVEGVSSNCFILIKNTWITPELRYNGVFGVMRAEILQRMQDQGIVYEQRYIGMDEISHIRSLFFCNALSPMKIVTQFEQRALDGNACIELFNRLRLNQMS